MLAPIWQNVLQLQKFFEFFLVLETIGNSGCKINEIVSQYCLNSRVPFDPTF